VVAGSQGDGRGITQETGSEQDPPAAPRLVTIAQRVVEPEFTPGRLRAIVDLGTPDPRVLARPPMPSIAWTSDAPRPPAIHPKAKELVRQLATNDRSEGSLRIRADDGG
jgi:hypothetical protein